MMVDEVDHHGDAERIGEQNKLLALVIALVPGVGEKPDALKPLFLCELNLLHKGVQVFHQAGHDLFDPGRRGLRQALYSSLQMNR